jgi:hypothetical protein
MKGYRIKFCKTRHLRNFESDVIIGLPPEVYAGSEYVQLVHDQPRIEQIETDDCLAAGVDRMPRFPRGVASENVP